MPPAFAAFGVPFTTKDQPNIGVCVRLCAAYFNKTLSIHSTAAQNIALLKKNQNQKALA